MLGLAFAGLLAVSVPASAAEADKLDDYQSEEVRTYLARDARPEASTAQDSSKSDDKTPAAGDGLGGITDKDLAGVDPETVKALKAWILDIRTSPRVPGCGRSRPRSSDAAASA